LGYLNDRAATSLKLGYHALTDYLEAKKAFSGTNDGEKLAAVLDARKTLREAMMAGALQKLDPAAKEWLKEMDKVFDTGADTIASSAKGDGLARVLVRAGAAYDAPAKLVVGADAV